MPRTLNNDVVDSLPSCKTELDPPDCSSTFEPLLLLSASLLVESEEEREVWSGFWGRVVWLFALCRFGAGHSSLPSYRALAQ